jgi:hypothetical protein
MAPPSKFNSVRAEQKNFVLGYNAPMFVATPSLLSKMFASTANEAAGAYISKTTTIKG